MIRRRLVIGSLLLLSILVLSSTFPQTAYAQEPPNGPYPDELIIFLHGDEATVVPKIEAGDMQGWLWWLNIENTKVAQASELTSLIDAYGLYNELFINPLETTEKFNPFSIREVREALNWLIDRRYITNEIWYGRGAPKWTIFKTVSPDYARVADYMKQLESKYEYDFERAKVQIFTALEEAGAVLQEGKWYYNGTLVTINFLIRIEDERKATGDYVATQLEKLGFTVERLYKPSRDAFRLWGALAPTQRGEWHIYTAGWISTAMIAYEDDLAWFMYSPDNAPAFEVYQPSPLLREAMDTLNNGEYQSTEERNELVKTVTELSLEDGVHIWYLDQMVSFPYSANMGPFIYDLYGGDQNYWALRSLRYTEPGGTIKLGARAIFVEGFNLGAGFSWLYDVYAYYLVVDYGVFPHPHTGRYIPVRTDFVVETAGPAGKLSVPSDALAFDVATRSFNPVGADVKATSKVTFTFTLGEWHHGQAINEADILHAIAEVFRLVTPGTDIYDPVAASPTRTIFVNNFKGIKFLSEDVAEVYIDYWHVDDSYIAWYANVWPEGPWELCALANKVVSEKKTAWSVDMADEWGVDMLDGTKGTSIPILADALETLAAENHIPPELDGIVTESEAAARWGALQDWYSETGHFWVGSGMYMFDKADPDALQMSFKAFRRYPFKADKWDSMLTVKIPEVAATEVPVNVVPGLGATFNFTVTVAGAPYERAEMKYLLIDPRGQVVASGTATSLGQGTFSVELTGDDTAGMAVGSNKMITITLGEEAALPVTKEIAFTVIPELAYFETLVARVSTELGGRISGVEGSVDTVSSAVDQLTTALNDARSTINILTGLAGISLVVAIVAVVLSLRKR